MINEYYTPVVLTLQPWHFQLLASSHLNRGPVHVFPWLTTLLGTLIFLQWSEWSTSISPPIQVLHTEHAGLAGFIFLRTSGLNIYVEPSSKNFRLLYFAFSSSQMLLRYFTTCHSFVIFGILEWGVAGQGFPSFNL